MTAVAPLDFEETPSIPLEISVSDGGATSAQHQLLVNVQDVNDRPPSMSIPELAVNSDAVAGDQVGGVTLEDPDG